MQTHKQRPSGWPFGARPAVVVCVRSLSECPKESVIVTLSPAGLMVWRLALGSRCVGGRGQCGQATKGVWGMSWRQKAKGRGRLRKVRGSCQTSFDPGIPELTQGTETSQYLEEEKENSIPSVAASERGIAQTTGVTSWGCRTTFRIHDS